MSIAELRHRVQFLLPLIICFILMSFFLGDTSLRAQDALFTPTSSISPVGTTTDEVTITPSGNPVQLPAETSTLGTTENPGPTEALIGTLPPLTIDTLTPPAIEVSTATSNSTLTPTFEYIEPPLDVLLVSEWILRPAISQRSMTQVFRDKGNLFQLSDLRIFFSS